MRAWSSPLVGGLVLAILSTVRNPWVRWPLMAWVDVFRAMPPLVLLVFIYAGLPFAGLEVSALGAVAIGFFLNTGAYYGEIFRAGLESVPAGQREAARALGLAARFISGYLYNPKGTSGRIGGGSTHAWVRIFLPGSGWVEFDPTNGIVGNAGLVRVAVARDPAQAIPISGTWAGFPNSDLGMDVRVDVSLDDPAIIPPAPPRAVADRK